MLKVLSDRVEHRGASLCRKGSADLAMVEVHEEGRVKEALLKLADNDGAQVLPKDRLSREQVQLAQLHLCDAGERRASVTK